VLVSPLIAPGTVFRTSGTVPLDHTSILKTVETRWGLPQLTARDAAAPGVGDVLTLAQSRTDDPLAGVTVPTSTVPNPVAGTPSHIQADLRPTRLRAAGQRRPRADPFRDACTLNRAGLPRLHHVAYGGVDRQLAVVGALSPLVGNNGGRVTARSYCQLSLCIPQRSSTGGGSFFR
jgi:hypothetical protein